MDVEERDEELKQRFVVVSGARAAVLAFEDLQKAMEMMAEACKVAMEPVVDAFQELSRMLTHGYDDFRSYYDEMNALYNAERIKRERIMLSYSWTRKRTQDSHLQLAKRTAHVEKHKPTIRGRI